VVHSDRPKFRGTLVEQFLLAILATIGFMDHQFDAHPMGCGNDAHGELSRRGLQQGRIANSIDRLKPRVPGDPSV
jgi:hypothetical protein